MKGFALAAMLPPWSYKSELLAPKPEAYHPFLQKVTILAKAINRNKPFCLACGSPLKPILTGQDASHSTLLPGRQYFE